MRKFESFLVTLENLCLCEVSNDQRLPNSLCEVSVAVTKASLAGAVLCDL